MPFEINLSKFVDPFFYGIIITSVLFGITTLQAWIYINTNRDNCLDFVHTCLTAQILHYYFVSNFGNLVIATTITKYDLLRYILYVLSTIISSVVIIEYLITLIITLVVESFFASRVWLIMFRGLAPVLLDDIIRPGSPAAARQVSGFSRLTGMVHWIVPILIAMAALGGTAAGIVGITDLFQDHSLASFAKHKTKLEVGCNASLSAVSDMITTIALLWGFSTYKTGIKRTDTLLEKLCRYIVTRGLFVTMDQTAYVIIFLTEPEKLWWTPFHFSLSKVYVITMVAMLNARDGLRKKASDDRIYLSDIDFRAGGDTSLKKRCERRQSRNYVRRLPYGWIRSHNLFQLEALDGETQEMIFVYTFAGVEQWFYTFEDDSES
ncbi:hypothetical protein K435DRAFT_838207 [Dendrothele bispora CBS 962.96]|uniref:DUF6534 domain-containing protein n=1 Tax=Dendrothele bispora (strain CBS 962.96) TaxID=1314807 RepID=A0A4S8M7H9_DENBC|nr:hypothetical protein K435DRAFT_838207 [Dendrothele bispora CBS 962.96]